MTWQLALGFILAVLAVSIPLAWLIHAFARELQVRKFEKQMQRVRDVMVLHDPKIKPKARPSNVRALKSHPREAA